jgi:hypothetical protein
MGRALVSSAEIFAVVYESSGDARRIAAADTAALVCWKSPFFCTLESRGRKRGPPRRQFEAALASMRTGARNASSVLSDKARTAA